MKIVPDHHYLIAHNLLLFIALPLLRFYPIPLQSNIRPGRTEKFKSSNRICSKQLDAFIYMRWIWKFKVSLTTVIHCLTGSEYRYQISLHNCKTNFKLQSKIKSHKIQKKTRVIHDSGSEIKHSVEQEVLFLIETVSHS